MTLATSKVATLARCVAASGTLVSLVGRIRDAECRFQEYNPCRQSLLKGVFLFFKRLYAKTAIGLSRRPRFRASLRHVRRYHGFYGWITVIVEAMVMFLIVSTFIVQAFAIPSTSMVPTLEVGDRIFVNKFVYRFRGPKRGDVAVFRVPDKIYDPEKPNYVKRIVGLPEDDLVIRAHPNLGYGRLYINGELPPKGSKTREIHYYYVPRARGIRDRTPLFLPEDVVDPNGLIDKIRDSEDPLSDYLRSQLSDRTLGSLAHYDENSSYRPLVLAALLGDFNRILYYPDLYNEARFAESPITPETRVLAAEKHAGRELVKVNRLLLDEAYPDELMRTLERTVPKGQVFCFGDNSGESFDSRSWGGVPEENLIGKAVFRFWPPSRFGPLD